MSDHLHSPPAKPLALSELFCSLQGESTWAGLPCVFVRLAGCNLRCRWCDTRHGYDIVMHRTPEQIIELVRQWEPVRLVEITGGEPLLQSGVIDLMNRLLAADYTVLLETNGSLPLDAVPDGVVRICDVKCPGSGEEDSFLDANLEALRPSRDQLKFVLANRDDYLFARRFIQRAPDGLECLFSPVHGLLEPSALADWIVEDRLPVRLQLQLHKLIWGADARGV